MAAFAAGIKPPADYRWEHPVKQASPAFVPEPRRLKPLRAALAEQWTFWLTRLSDAEAEPMVGIFTTGEEWKKYTAQKRRPPLHDNIRPCLICGVFQVGAPWADHEGEFTDPTSPNAWHYRVDLETWICPSCDVIAGPDLEREKLIQLTDAWRTELRRRRSDPYSKFTNEDLHRPESPDERGT